MRVILVRNILTDRHRELTYFKLHWPEDVQDENGRLRDKMYKNRRSSNGDTMKTVSIANGYHKWRTFFLSSNFRGYEECSLTFKTLIKLT